MTHPDLPRFLRHLITCPPADVPGAFLVFADWLEEHGDERCGLVRKVVARGPVDVEPIPPAFDLFESHPRISPNITPRFAGYGGTFGGKPDDVLDEGWRTWRSSISEPEAAREFLHRLRVQCLTLFREHIEAHGYNTIAIKMGYPAVPGLPVSPLRVDPRWPPLPCPVCDATMCRCEGCGAEWCLEITHKPSQFVGACPECGESPRHWMSGHAGTLTIGGQTLQVTDWNVGAAPRRLQGRPPTRRPRV